MHVSRAGSTSLGPRSARKLQEEARKMNREDMGLEKGVACWTCFVW